MNLNKLPKTKAYKFQNEKTIREMCERFHVNPHSIPKYPNLTWEEKYPRYIEAITGHKPCPICNGPQRYDPSRARTKIDTLFYGGIVCVDYPGHTLRWNMAIMALRHELRDLKVEIPNGSSALDVPGHEELFEDLLIKALGPVCEHGHFSSDCMECIERMKDNAAQRQLQNEVSSVPAMV